MTMDSLEQLHRMYRDSLHEKRDELRRVWERLAEEPVADAAVREMHHRLHQLQGSAGAYGYDHICIAARTIERRWSLWLAQRTDQRLPIALVRAELGTGMARLLDALTVAGQSR